MRLIKLAGLVLVVVSCSNKKEIPEFTPAQPTREEQEQTSCYENYSTPQKLELANSLLIQIANYELMYNITLRRKDFTICEEELLTTLIRQRGSEPQFRDYYFFERETVVWNFLKEEAKRKIRYNITQTD